MESRLIGKVAADVFCCWGNILVISELLTGMDLKLCQTTELVLVAREKFGLFGATEKKSETSHLLFPNALLLLLAEE